MLFQWTAFSIPLFLCLFQRVVCLAQMAATATTTTRTDPEVKVAVGEEEGEGVEEEVLGPLRVWHIVFLVGVVISIAVTIFCCCVEWRIPRTRQEIEETYRRRQLNQKYLHQLERTPDLILRNNNNNNNNNNDEDNETVDRTRPHRRQNHNEHEHHHHHNHHHRDDNDDNDHPSHHHHPPRASHLNHQDHRQPRNHAQSNHHHHHPRPHQQHQRQNNNSSHTAAGLTTPRSGDCGVSVTEASGRLDRVPKSNVLGVKTPFQLSAITALQKQRQQRGQQQH